MEPSSIVWNFFTKCDNDCYVECKCGAKKLKYSGATGGMIRHTREAHIDEMRAIEKRKKPGLNNQSVDVVQGASSQVEIDEKLIQALSTSNVPFQFVKNQSFLEFCKLLNPNVRILTPDRIKRRLSTTADAYVAEVKNELKIVDKMFLSLDGWDGKNELVSLYAVYVYAIDKELNVKKIFLGIRHLDGLATHQAVGNLVTDLLAVYGISIEAIVGAVTDAASNLSSFWRKNSIFHIHCCAHSIALILKGASNLPILTGIAEKINNLASHLSRSKTERATFRRRSANLGIEGRIPLPYCVTRWGGFILLAQLYYLHYQSISSLTRFQDFLMSPEEMETLEEFINLTRPFTEAISQAEKDQSFCSEILAQYASLLDFLSHQNGRKRIVQFLKKETLNRYTRYMMNDAILLATLCDPRFAYLEGILLNMKWEDVEKDAELYCDSYRDIQNGVVDSSPTFPNTPSMPPKSNFHSFLESKRSSTSSNTTKSELVAYRALVDSGRPSIDTSPLSFWTMHKDKFPKLVNLARHFLPSPQSSAQVERLFSRCGQIVASSRRNRLASTTLNDMLLCSFLSEKKRMSQKKETGEEESDESDNEDGDHGEYNSSSQTTSIVLHRSTSAPQLTCFSFGSSEEEMPEAGGTSQEEIY